LKKNPQNWRKTVA